MINMYSFDHGRRTQFYIDMIYGVLFVIGFLMLMYWMDVRIAAFQGGLVIGYILHVWEKMIGYEQALSEAVSTEAEEVVAEEAQQQVASEAEEAVASEMEGRMDGIEGHKERIQELEELHEERKERIEELEQMYDEQA